MAATPPPRGLKAYRLGYKVSSEQTLPKEKDDYQERLEKKALEILAESEEILAKKDILPEIIQSANSKKRIVTDFLNALASSKKKLADKSLSPYQRYDEVSLISTLMETFDQFIESEKILKEADMLCEETYSQTAKAVKELNPARNIFTRPSWIEQMSKM